jgi:LCP family protein required for cell wall assembly
MSACGSATTAAHKAPITIGISLSFSDDFSSGNRQAACATVAAKVADVTGLDTPYWLLINFNGFCRFIDAIGGISIDVPHSFDALYPKNDDFQIDPSWIVIHFSKGMQKMDGETALRYVRAIHVFGENKAEGSDFARSLRQQRVIRAALGKVKLLVTWSSLYRALTTLQNAIYTNLSLIDIIGLIQGMDLDTGHNILLNTQMY